MTCTCCNRPLTGGTDTLGDRGVEMCQLCYLALCEESQRAHADYMENQRAIIADLDLTAAWAASEAAKKREEMEQSA